MTVQAKATLTVCGILPADVVMDIHGVLHEAHGIPAAAAAEPETPEFVDVALSDPADVQADHGGLELDEHFVPLRKTAQKTLLNYA